MSSFTRKFVIEIAASVAVFGIVTFFIYGLLPASANTSAPQTVVQVAQGEGFHEVITGLAQEGLVRSSFVTEAVSLLTGSAFHLQPGLYKVSAAMSPHAILNELSGAKGGQVSVTLPEGITLYQMDAMLADALVIRKGDLIRLQEGGTEGNLEGKLFPDTYFFYTNANVSDVAQKMMDNFNTKAAPLLAGDGTNAARDLVMASIIDKEVANPADQKIVAGILWKRLNAGMPLQVDAGICYAMQLRNPTSTPNCGALDFTINSPYNTYLYKGLPPGPIGNPGISAIQAALHPVSSPYWFYLSDPETGKTIFAKTLDEQHQNTVKYLVK